jgi:predicted RNase H-like nuclease (RuvC/YqgF family)
MERDALMRSVNDLLKHQTERASALQELTHDKSAYQNFTAEKAQFTQQYNQQEILAEIREQETRLKDFLPVDVAQAKTTDERRAMESHNERFNQLNKFFTDTLTDISKSPRGWVRGAIEATRSQIMNQQIINLEQELKELKTERDQLKRDMEKINGARRKITHAAPTTAEGIKKNGQGLSLKDVADPRKALSAYWEEVDRNQ